MCASKIKPEDVFKAILEALGVGKKRKAKKKIYNVNKLSHGRKC